MNEYIRMRSWHLIRTWTRVPGRAITLCGRTVQNRETANTLPMDEKSCETCLRMAEFQRDDA